MSEQIERYRAFVKAIMEKTGVCPVCSYLWSECSCGISGESGTLEENPRIGWDEPPDDETLDEFVARDVEMIHFEALDDCRWYANVWLKDGQFWQLNFGSRSGRAKGYAYAEQVELQRRAGV